METGKKSRHGKGSQAHTRIPHPEQGAWGEEPVQRLVVKVNNDSVHLGETRVCWRPSAPPPVPVPGRALLLLLGVPGPVLQLQQRPLGSWRPEERPAGCTQRDLRELFVGGSSGRRLGRWLYCAALERGPTIPPHFIYTADVPAPVLSLGRPTALRPRPAGFSDPWDRSLRGGLGLLGRVSRGIGLAAAELCGSTIGGAPVSP